jgi:hypothetical protein
MKVRYSNELWPMLKTKLILSNSCMTRILIVSSMISVIAFQANLSNAQGLPRQTAAEKQLQSACRKRSDGYIGDPFTYPLLVTALPGVDALVVFVDGEKWAARSEPERFTMMRDVACWYAGGRMLKSVWYSFSAVETGTNRIVGTFPGEKLWPTSGRYQ